MNICLIITKKSDGRNIKMFEKSAKVFPTTFIKQDSSGKVVEIENVRSLTIERRGF